MDPGFGFCQQLLKFPSSPPPEHYPDPMLHIFSGFTCSIHFWQNTAHRHCPGYLIQLELGPASFERKEKNQQKSFSLPFFSFPPFLAKSVECRLIGSENRTNEVRGGKKFSKGETKTKETTRKRLDAERVCVCACVRTCVRVSLCVCVLPRSCAC